MEMPRRAEHIAFGLAVCAAAAGLVYAIAQTQFVPLGDVLHTMLGAVARAHVDDPALGFGHFVTANNPAAALGFNVVFDPLERVLGWRGAYQATAAIVLCAWALGVGAVVVAQDVRRRWLVLLGAATAAQWVFFLGLWSFAVGLAAGLCFVAAGVRWGP